MEQIRADNRIKILNAANGYPPLTPEQAKKMGIKVNVNFGELTVLFSHARRQMTEALLNNKRFFTITIPDAPEDEQVDWETFITRTLNRYVKNSEEYASVKENQIASVVAHGIGPQIWEDHDCWKPNYVAIEDFRVPTDTETSLRNLSWCAVRKLYTEGELSRKVFGKYSDQGWNKPKISQILHEYHNQNWETTNYDWINAPEKMAELIKQNAGAYSSDAVPTIPLWHFYFMDDSDPMKPVIKLRVVPDLGVRGTAANDEFLYDSEDIVAYKWYELLNVQYGDLNNKSPFMHYSVRGLGFLLMEPCYWMNLFRCRYLQHGMENFNAWFRVADPQDRARVSKIELFDKAILPEEVAIVPNTERHQINAQVIDSIMAQMKQLQGEVSQSYTQQMDTGTKKEQTAFETRAKIAQVNAMMSGILGKMFRKETSAYREICRRFCLRNSTDPDVQEFQDECKKHGIPPLYLNVNYWEVDAEVPMGSGNPTMAESEIQTLMEWRPMFDPQAQQEILHQAVTVLTRDPRRADRWAPLDGQRGVSDAQRDAEFAFGTLMQGVPVRMKQGLNPNEQIETLLGLMAGVIAQIEKNGAMADAREITGFQTVAQYVGKLIQQISQDDTQKPKVKEYSDSLGKLMNTVKAFAQRLQEQQKKQAGANGADPAAMAKVQAMTMQAQVKSQIGKSKAAQDMHLKEMAFKQEEQRKNIQTVHDIARQNEVNRMKTFSHGED